MIYVTLPSNSSMDIYPDNKISSFKVNLPETLQVDPEHWEVALKEIQFPHLWYNVTKDKNYFIGWYNTVIGHSSNKKIEFKFMKEAKPGYYSSMPEMVAELNAKIPTGPNTLNLHSDGFNICFIYNSFSNKTFVAMSHGVSKKIEGSDLAMQMGFKENEVLHGSTPTVSPFMMNMKRYTALYVYTDIIQNQLVGDVRAPLLRVVPVKSRYRDTTCVNYEQPQFLPLSRSNIQFSNNKFTTIKMKFVNIGMAGITQKNLKIYIPIAVPFRK